MQFLFECSTRYIRKVQSIWTREEKFNNSRQPLLRCLLYKHLTNKRNLFYSRCNSFMALNRTCDVSAADWRSQTHVKLTQFFRCGDFFFVVEIPIMHSSLYNELIYLFITFSVDAFLSSQSSSSLSSPLPPSSSDHSQLPSAVRWSLPLEPGTRFTWNQSAPSMKYITQVLLKRMKKSWLKLAQSPLKHALFDP